MNNVNINLFCKEIGTDMFAGQFMGYWILVGENENGFHEAPSRRFYRSNTEKTAFIVNLTDKGYSVTAVYGFTPSSIIGDFKWLFDTVYHYEIEITVLFESDYELLYYKR